MKNVNGELCYGGKATVKISLSPEPSMLITFLESQRQIALNADETVMMIDLVRSLDRSVDEFSKGMTGGVQ